MVQPRLLILLGLGTTLLFAGSVRDCTNTIDDFKDNYSELSRNKDNEALILFALRSTAECPISRRIRESIGRLKSFFQRRNWLINCRHNLSKREQQMLQIRDLSRPSMAIYFRLPGKEKINSFVLPFKENYDATVKNIISDIDRVCKSENQEQGLRNVIQKFGLMSPGDPSAADVCAAQ